MRIIGPIFLIVFTIVTVYLTKNDAFSFFNKIKNIGTKVERVETIPDTTVETKEIILAGEQNSFTRESVTPGPFVKEVANTTVSATTSPITLLPEDIIRATISVRINNGVNQPLVENEELKNSAQLKVNDMFQKNYFEHVSPIGVRVSDLSTQVGYDYILIGENLALGNFTSATDLVNAWMESPGHRSNILNPKYRDIGIAVGYGDILGKKTWMIVQHFGVSTNICPKVDEDLKTSIEATTEVISNNAIELETQKNKIESMKVYQKNYGDLVDLYNNGVKDYNNLVLTIKEKISDYNNQVNLFNLCVGGLSY